MAINNEILDVARTESRDLAPKVDETLDDSRNESEEPTPQGEEKPQEPWIKVLGTFLIFFNIW